MDLLPGMVVARPVIGGPRNQLTLRIAVGSKITTDTIYQLVNKGIECVAVHEDAEADASNRSEAVQAYEARLEEIFGSQPDESCSQLMRALRAERQSKC